MKSSAFQSRLISAGVIAAALIMGVAGCSVAGSNASTAKPGDSASAAGSSSATPGPGTSSPSNPNATAMCSTAQLSGNVGERNGQAAGSGAGMNQERLAIILTNTGQRPCTLQGWPGVSYVGDGNGTQLGSSAVLDRTTAHPTVTLAPHASAQAPIDFVAVAVFPASSCRPQPVDGLRVYPPGNKQALLIKGGGAGNYPAKQIY